MALTAEEKQKVMVWWVREAFKKPRKVATCGQANGVLPDTVDAIDAWVTANQASFVTALPAEFKTLTDVQQKTLMLVAVVLGGAGIPP